MTDNAAPDAPRSPFHGVASREVVRDVVAAAALLVALPMPWDVTHRGSDRLEIVLVTVLSLLTLAIPYVRRAGVGAPSWDTVTTPRARLLGNLPYLVVAVLYLVLDAVRPDAGEGAVGAGLVLGLAGVLLAIAPTWERTLPVVAALVALGALATPVASLVAGAAWPATVVAVLNAALVIGVLWLTVVAYMRGELTAGLLLLAVGGAIAIELVLFAGGSESPWFESLHGQRLGLLLLPVLAACAARGVLDAAAATTSETAAEHAARWVRIAVRSFDLVMLVAGFVALVALVRLVGDRGDTVPLVLRLVVGALMVGVALAARRALVRDPRQGHTTAVGAACVLVVLGLVIVVARAGLGTQSNVEELLATFGLPGIVLVALLVPASVRDLVSASEPAPGTGTGHERGHDAGHHARRDGGDDGAQGGVADGPRTAAQPAVRPAAQPTAHRPSPPDSRPGSRQPGGPAPQQPWGTAPVDATQQLQPVRDVDPPASRASWETAVQPPVQSPAQQPVQQPVHEPTQVLPPVADVSGSPWSAAQAMDPGTSLADLARIVQEAPHLRAYVASNPSTYPALLDWLGALGDPAVDAALRSRR
ncbi:hypothetical protein LEP48_16260 [Isoptericola sp. NEAU-Y5]|uniref:Uncharacterized protein n=1 Tax=Isoptericola luteus TaxID=2879484 RepID=A0ABS7ZKI9_9MICO|nr:hypothetical protein [Isoptericola sp. NEAU-Y5]MCA5894891.1 hypothetical protein [Isoptericola sp. NEAU-Y5]